MPEESGNHTNIAWKSMAENWWNIILREVSDPVAVVSTDYELIWANRTLLGFLGLELDQLNRRTCYELVLKRTKRCPDCPVSLTFSSGKPAVLEKSFRCAEGTVVWREIRTYPIRATDGTLTGALRIGFDITRKKVLDDLHARHVEVLERTLNEMSETPRDESRDCGASANRDNLTDREVQVLRLVAKGLSNTEISGILKISAHTVKSHVVHVFRKLGVNSRTDAAVTAVRLNLI